MTQRRITSFFPLKSSSKQSSDDDVSVQSGADVMAEEGHGIEGNQTARRAAKRKSVAASTSKSVSSQESSPAKKQCKDQVEPKSLEEKVVSEPVPYEMLNQPGPSGLQVVSSSTSDSPSQSSDDSSSSIEFVLEKTSSAEISSCLSEQMHPISTVLIPRETARRVHAMELRPGIVRRVKETNLEELETRMKVVKEEQDEEECELFRSQSPRSISVLPRTSRTPSLASVDISMASTASIPASSVLSLESSGSSDCVLEQTPSDSCMGEQSSSRMSSEESVKSQECSDSTSVQTASMQISSPGPSPTAVKSPICSGSLIQSPSGKEAEDNDAHYNPTQSEYHPIDSAVWNYSSRVPYLALAKTLHCIEQESSRLRITDILANFFRSVIVLSPDDLLPSVYLCLNKLAPAYEGLELGLAETTLMKAIAECTGRALEQIRADTDELGDLGAVAEKSRMKQNTMFKSNVLTVSGVYAKLMEIAKMAGKSSMKQKKSKVINLLVACRGIEARYLVRSLSGKLRIGLAEQSVLQAIAVACTKTPLQQGFPPETLDVSKNSPEVFKSQLERNALIIKTAYCEYPDYGKLIQVLLKDGIEALPKQCHLTAGIPLKPMLAQPTKGIKDIFQRFENSVFTCEWKYDGERAQIHLAENGEVSIYSRNQENNTSKYPDVITIVQKAVKTGVTSFILDCEAVAWDAMKQHILPFQILSTRKRKHVSSSQINVEVCIFAFDLLLLNGEPLIKKPLCERRALLSDMFTPIQGGFQFAMSMDTNIMEEVQIFLDEAIKGRCEGLMVKTLEEDATYEIAKRSRNWLKLKKDYLDGMGDSIDVVVIGGYRGQGKRAGLYGGFLLACYDPSAEEFQTLCKIGTGFSDEDLAKHTKFFNKFKISEPRPYYRYDKSHTPDDWFEAVQVWEVKGADLTYSPTHWAAKGLCGSDQRGISLRFPRFLRIREDKSVEDITSSEQIAEMYMNQAQIESSGSAQRNVEDDFY